MQVTVEQVLQVEGHWSDAGEMHGGRGERAFLGRFAHGGLDLPGSLRTVATPFVPIAVDKEIGSVSVARHQLVERGLQPRISERSLRQVEAAGGAAAELSVELLQVGDQLAQLWP